MQGLFQLSIIGSEPQMLSFLKKCRANDVLWSWVSDVLPEGAEGCVRLSPTYGLKQFGDKWRLLIATDSSGNISFIPEMVQEVSDLEPGLEVILLTQYIDYQLQDQWYVDYWPAGQKKPLPDELMISKNHFDSGWQDLWIQETDTADLSRWCCKNWKPGVTQELLDQYIQSFDHDEPLPPQLEAIQQMDYDGMFMEYYSDLCSHRPYDYDEPDHEGFPSIEYLICVTNLVPVHSADTSASGSLDPEDLIPYGNWDSAVTINLWNAEESPADGQYPNLIFDRPDPDSLYRVDYVLVGSFARFNGSKRELTKFIGTLHSRVMTRVTDRVRWVLVGSKMPGSWCKHWNEDHNLVVGAFVHQEKGQLIGFLREEDFFAALASAPVEPDPS